MKKLLLLCAMPLFVQAMEPAAASAAAPIAEPVAVQPTADTFELPLRWQAQVPPPGGVDIYSIDEGIIPNEILDNCLCAGGHNGVAPENDPLNKKSHHAGATDCACDDGNGYSCCFAYSTNATTARVTASCWAKKHVKKTFIGELLRRENSPIHDNPLCCGYGATDIFISRQAVKNYWYFARIENFLVLIRDAKETNDQKAWQAVGKQLNKMLYAIPFIKRTIDATQGTQAENWLYEGILTGDELFFPSWLIAENTTPAPTAITVPADTQPMVVPCAATTAAGEGPRHRATVGPAEVTQDHTGSPVAATRPIDTEHGQQ